MPTVADLRARTKGLMLADRRAFRRRLDGVEGIASSERRRRVLAAVAADLEEAERRVDRRRMSLPRHFAYPADLPITERREELLQTIRDNQVVIVAGETGSGKSTQLPKLCLESGRGIDGFIGHTQPRRIAARAIAERIAEETGTTVGGLVGYTVRFTDQVGDATLVKVMTDGILLNEIHRDRQLTRYDTIIVDEAHERSLNIDFILGYLTSLLPKRPDLKVIITSATIDTVRFSDHFGGAPVVEVSGRTYPVDVRYRPLDDPDHDEPRDQPQGICDAVVELAAEGTGDILVFCSGEREIRDAARALTELRLSHTEILPLYARLSSAEQHRVFEPHTGRRIVLATNVAETSLTVPGIRYVVDPGTARISRYSRRTKVQRLPIEPVSRASADQRSGRCGRVAPGVCIRLYTEEDYATRSEFTEPEIQRTNLASVILQMSALDLGDVESFPFLDPPDTRTVRDGISLLEELGAVDPEHEGTGRWLTKTGRRLAQMPLDPRLGRMVIEADGNGCLREALIIVAALAIQDPRERPTGKEDLADRLHARFVDPGSDLLSWLHMWEYLRTERRARTSSSFRRMCREEFLNYRRVREWQDVHAQLRDVADELGLVRNREAADPDTLHRSLLAGLLSQVGMKDPDGHDYRGARGIRFFIAPGSTLFKRSPAWVMAAELVETTRLWARGVAPVRPDDVERAGAHLVKRSYSDPWWDPGRGSAMANETVTLYGLPLQTSKAVQYGRVDPVGARDSFIRHALVAGEWDSHHDFVVRNRETIAEVLALERRYRRADLLVSDEVLFGLFDERIPGDVVSARHFDRWWKEASQRTPDLLDLRLDDVVDPSVGDLDASAFPEVWTYGDVIMPLEYEFDSSSPSDGVTIEVPVAVLDRIDPTVFDWNVPGLREELVTWLIRSLPKRLRKLFTPVPETVRNVLDGAEPGEGGLIPFLRRELTRLGGVGIPPDAFDLDRLPAHLRPAFRVVSEEGAVLAEGTELARIKEALREEVRARSTGLEIEQSGLTSWSFGELPHRVEIGGSGGSVAAYPALVDEGDSVGIRVFATPDEQMEAMWDGVRRLLLLRLPSAGRLLRPLLEAGSKLALAAGPYETPGEWMDDCLACALDRILLQAGGLPWDGVAFDALVAATRDDLYDEVTDVASVSLQILDTARAVHTALDRATASTLQPAVGDMRDQMARLVYPGFLTALGATRLEDVHRYVKGIEHRLERLPDNQERDRQMMSRIHRLEDEYERLAESLPASPEVIEVAWMLQELRVSFFAQTLGTRGSVSEKRIRAALADLATPT